MQKKKAPLYSVDKLIPTLGVCQFDFLQFFKRPWLQNQYLILTLCVNYYILLRICYSQQIQSKSSKNQYYIFRNSYYCQQTQTVDCLFRLYFTFVQCLQTGFAFSEKSKINVQHLLTIPALSTMGSNFCLFQLKGIQ